MQESHLGPSPEWWVVAKGVAQLQSVHSGNLALQYLSLSLYIYIYIYVCICIYVYVLLCIYALYI